MVAGESLGRPVQDLGDEREAVLERLRLQGDASDEQAAADIDMRTLTCVDESIGSTPISELDISDTRLDEEPQNRQLTSHGC